MGGVHRNGLIVRRRQRWILGGVEIHQTADAIRDLGTERVQDVAAARVPNEEGFLSSSVVITSRMSSALR
jgi:hypothetical protein